MYDSIHWDIEPPQNGHTANAASAYDSGCRGHKPMSDQHKRVCVARELFERERDEAIRAGAVHLKPDGEHDALEPSGDGWEFAPRVLRLHYLYEAREQGAHESAAKDDGA